MELTTLRWRLGLGALVSFVLGLGGLIWSTTTAFNSLTSSAPSIDPATGAVLPGHMSIFSPTSGSVVAQAVLRTASSTLLAVTLILVAGVVLSLVLDDHFVRRGAFGEPDVDEFIDEDEPGSSAE